MVEPQNTTAAVVPSSALAAGPHYVPAAALGGGSGDAEGHDRAAVAHGNPIPAPCTGAALEVPLRRIPAAARRSSHQPAGTYPSHALGRRAARPLPHLGRHQCVVHQAMKPPTHPAPPPEHALAYPHTAAGPRLLVGVGLRQGVQALAP